MPRQEKHPSDSELLRSTPGQPPEPRILAGFGSPVTVNYKQVAYRILKYALRDFESARIEFSEPQPRYISISTESGTVKVGGFVVTMAINQKNEFGAYTGYEFTSILFRNNDPIAYKPNGGDWIWAQ